MNGTLSIILTLLLLTFSGCVASQVSIGSGGVGVGGSIGAGSGGVGVGVGTGRGIGISLSSYGDALFSSGSTYSNNRRGVQELLAKDYTAAEKTFLSTLEQDPGNPDGVYYLGLTLIYLDKRKEGFDLLKQYHDPQRYRVTQAVLWWANYLEKKPELTPKKIHETMNKNRMDAYNRESRENRELLWD